MKIKLNENVISSLDPSSHMVYAFSSFCTVISVFLPSRHKFSMRIHDIQILLHFNGLIFFFKIHIFQILFLTTLIFLKLMSSIFLSFLQADFIIGTAHPFIRVPIQYALFRVIFYIYIYSMDD